MLKWTLKKVPIWIILSTVGTEIIRYFQLLRVLPFWQILIATAFIIRELGVPVLGIFVSYPLIFFLVLSITRKKYATWITYLFIFGLSRITRRWCSMEWCLNDFQLSLESIYFSYISTAWIHLRCISFSMHVIDSGKSPANVKYLAYCVYLPNLLFGPFISFEDFQNCYETCGDTKKRFFALIANVARFLFWFGFVEFFLHFSYVNAINFYPEWIRSFDLVSLYGYGYSMSHYFHIKYVIFYGLATTFAKFENVKVPSLPVCIGRIHLYSDMWKYFDAGLYNFLLKCIYIPLAQSYWTKNQLLRSLICFTFVYAWHGMSSHILLWSTLNYLGIVTEYVSKRIGENFLQKMGVKEKFGDTWFRRLTCLATTPLLIMSALSNFYFFAGEEVGHIFTWRTLNAGIQAKIILFLVMYSCCQVSTEIKFQLHNKTVKQKTN